MIMYTPGASLWRTDKEEDTLSSGNLSVLSSFGESFMDMVAKNACSWHAVSRVSTDHVNRQKIINSITYNEATCIAQCIHQSNSLLFICSTIDLFA